MKRKFFLLVAIIATIIPLTSCKGRYADNTPNGEVVEVDINPIDDTHAQQEPEGEPSIIDECKLEETESTKL